MIKTLCEGHGILTTARLVGKCKAGRYVKKHGLKDNQVSIEYSHKYTKAFMPKIQPDVEYDLAISFLTPHYFVTEKVRAKKKIAWIHTDYQAVQVDVKSELKMWEKYDYIASISNDVTKSFLKIFPVLKEKIVLIENILPQKLIEQQSKEKIKEIFKNEDDVHLLSIGRFSYPKNFDNVPEICRYINEQGINAKWYIIGYGSDEELIRQKIRKFEMEDKVILLGKKENPYPYIKACDLYVQPSRYEGKCVAVREAQMLGKPVVITNYATAASQLEDGIDGMIVPMDNKECAKKIIKLIKDAEMQKRLCQNLKTRNYTNAHEINKLYKLLESD